ncbi:hypothetical protein [Exiguobacterium sp. s28]|uniref:hypothetical protein n=1 Tax=Exiguobacterium sp. s28 TaxID=2751238 RepID=UPI001BECB269|nr:hypothetical protein [Exiguobacterium sp. s28]
MKKSILIVICLIIFLSGCSDNEVTYTSVKEEVIELGESSFDYKLTKFEYEKNENTLAVEYDTNLPENTTVLIGITPWFPDTWGDEFNSYFNYGRRLTKDGETKVQQGKISYAFTNNDFEMFKAPSATYSLRVIVPLSDIKNPKILEQIQDEEDFEQIYPKAKDDKEKSYYLFIDREQETEKYIYWYDESIELTSGHTLAEIDDSYVSIPYRELLKNPRKFEGELVEFNGEVLEIHETSSNAYDRIGYDSYLRLDIGDDQVIYVDHYSFVGMKEVYKGDFIKVQGKITGSETYTSVAGYKITVPSMEAVTYFK